MNTNQSTETPITVVKFGSSILSCHADIPKAVHEIYRYYREGQRILVIVSALAGTTDNLIEVANKLVDDVNSEPEPRALATLLATGELATTALFVIALQRAGIPATHLDNHCLQTTQSVLDAEPITLDIEQINTAFLNHSVVVIPGFVGTNSKGEQTLLGRGGSDLSALYCAWAIKAKQCILIKDVDGIYDRDPNVTQKPVRRYKTLSHYDALQIANQVIQKKALIFAQKNVFCFIVRTLGSQNGTYVGNVTTQFRTPLPSTKPLKVTLLGLGTVGYGVYQRLCANQKDFQVVAIAVTDKEKHSHQQIPAALLTTNLAEALKRDTDVVIELLGGLHPATSIIEQALWQDRHVVTANKAVIATTGLKLEKIAQQQGVFLCYSSAVAAAIPILENLTLIKCEEKIESIEGVFNGTTNFILDLLAQGKDFDVAVKNAQNCGFAEADPSLDLNGTDAAQKMIITARFAFGVTPTKTTVRGIDQLNPLFVQQAGAEKKVIRLLATSHKTGNSVMIHVAPTVLSNHHPLASVKNEGNRILIRTKSKKTILFDGKGAGRWPTTEAVYADLLDIISKQRHIKNQKLTDKLLETA